jgi:hypothetical protein
LGVGTSLLALLAASGPAAAAPKPITGKLSKPGYTVIALAASGKARAVRAGRGKFRLVPPSKRVTLHLRARNGVYAGPIVVGSEKKGRRAIVGVKAGARLGRVKARKGYAKVTRRLPKRSLDSGRQARATKGVPIGARKFGRVRSRRARGPDADRDLDGIPSPLDIDDDGDLILDNLDRSSGPRASVFATIFNPFSQLTLYLDTTVNANASAVTTDQIDLTLSRSGSLIMGSCPATPRSSTAEGPTRAQPAQKASSTAPTEARGPCSASPSPSAVTLTVTASAHSRRRGFLAERSSNTAPGRTRSARATS